MKTINAFQGEYRFLSNFWPCSILYKNLVYPSTEHAYQAAKTGNTGLKVLISTCPTPADAKEFFRTNTVKPDDGWTVDRKLAVMEELLLIKFGGSEPLLTRALLLTGEAQLIEGNNWNDHFWGVCNNTGENNLGLLLMKVREELLRQKVQFNTLLAQGMNNKAISDELAISERCLYHKMIGFSIPNKEFWIT